MKKKAVKLFEKAIHEVKDVVSEMKQEREVYWKKRAEAARKHDAKMNKMMKEMIVVINDLYELFDNLYTNGNGKEDK